VKNTSNTFLKALVPGLYATFLTSYASRIAWNFHICLRFLWKATSSKASEVSEGAQPWAKHQQQRRATKKGWVPCRDIGYNWLLNMGSYHEQFLESGQYKIDATIVYCYININTTLESQVLYTWSHQPMIKRYPVSTTSAWSIGCLSSTWNLNIVSFHIRFWKYKMSPTVFHTSYEKLTRFR